MSVSILCPTAGELDYPVVPEGTGGTGFICARVEVVDNRGGVQETDIRVFAKVFPGRHDASSPTVPLEHPVLGSDPCVSEGQSEGNFRWLFPHVSCARVGSTENDVNTIVAWVKFPGSVSAIRRFHPFFGTFAAQTACAGSGMGRAVAPSPPPPPPLPPSGCSGIVLDTVPFIWTLLATGFKAGKSVFNGPWNLRLTDGADCVWDNGGDAVVVPHVELRCESPIVKTWRLTIRHGATALEYTRAASEWNALAANTLHRSGNGNGLGVEQLTVIPG